MPIEIDDFISQWHNATPCDSTELYEFLGMARDEYEAWIMDPSVLPEILNARNENIPLPIYLSTQDCEVAIAARAKDKAALIALRNWLKKRQEECE